MVSTGWRDSTYPLAPTINTPPQDEEKWLKKLLERDAAVFLANDTGALPIDEQAPAQGATQAHQDDMQTP